MAGVGGVGANWSRGVLAEHLNSPACKARLTHVVLRKVAELTDLLGSILHAQIATRIAAVGRELPAVAPCGFRRSVTLRYYSHKAGWWRVYRRCVHCLARFGGLLFWQPSKIRL